MQMNIIQEWNKKRSLGIKSLAILIDPDFAKIKNLEEVIALSIRSGVDYFFIGGSLILQDRLDECIKLIRESCNIPIILFPGSGFQISNKANAILVLSLISGRNPEYLIGKHVESAGLLYSSKLQTIPTGYMLIDGGPGNTATYISHTQAIPHNKLDIALATALAGKFLGMQSIFLDAGSGAIHSVSDKMISKINEHVDLPLIVGGGIKTLEIAQTIYDAGADIVVIGNAAEKNPTLITEFAGLTKSYTPIGLTKIK